MDVALWVIGYLVVFAVTWGFLTEDKDDEDDVGKSFVLAIMWPGVLPFLVLCFVALGAHKITKKYLK